MDPVEFPDTTTIVVNHLASELDGAGYDIGVYSDVPNPRPTEFVTVKRVGGPRRNLVADGAQLVIDAWAGDDVAAHDIAQIARSYLNAMYGEVVGGVQVYRVDELSGPGSKPDPESGQARYSFQTTVMVRGTPLTTGS